MDFSCRVCSICSDIIFLKKDSQELFMKHIECDRCKKVPKIPLRIHLCKIFFELHKCKIKLSHLKYYIRYGEWINVKKCS